MGRTGQAPWKADFWLYRPRLPERPVPNFDIYQTKLPLLDFVPYLTEGRIWVRTRGPIGPSFGPGIDPGQDGEGCPV